MKAVYLACPISDGGKLDNQARWNNVHNAMAVFVRLVEQGCYPLCPALTQLVDDRYPGQITYDQWMDVSFSWVERADCVFRVPGFSSGADRECDFAKSRGIPVFHNYADLDEWVNYGIIEEEPLGDQFPVVPCTPKKNVLEEAAELVHGDRRRDYDHPRPNHVRIGKFWGVQLENYVKTCKPGDPVPPRTVALCMIGTKLAREAFTPKRDSLVDICGYARCVECIDEMEQCCASE